VKRRRELRENGGDKEDIDSTDYLSPASSVGDTKISCGFSIPPYAKEGGSIKISNLAREKKN
jgi:hypothetical protein